MPSRLQDEIQQTRPFVSLEDEVLIALLRTADVALRPLTDVLKAHSLSHTQYNVLRILRGAGPGGLSCREVAERMTVELTETAARDNGSFGIHPVLLDAGMQVLAAAFPGFDERDDTSDVFMPIGLDPVIVTDPPRPGIVAFAGVTTSVTNGARR